METTKEKDRGMMIKCRKKCTRWLRSLPAWLLSALPLFFVSCIDEDLSRCGVNYIIDYRLELSASLRLTLDEELTTPAEQELAAALRQDLADVMSERAAVMDLSFFTVDGGSLTQHQTVEPDASSLSMTVYMNRGNYYNIALAATRQEPSVSIANSTEYRSINLQQEAADTVDAHRAAIYMGYELLQVDEASNHFYVPLYMVNSVPVLVVDPNGSPAETVAAYTRRTASGIVCSDSTFTYDHSAVVRTLRTDGGGLVAYHSVCFPSTDASTSRAGSDITESEGSLWEMDLYTRMPDGEYVKNTLYIKDPLRAGEMQVIKVRLDDEGRVVTDNPEVGVSVELDWKPGGDFDIEM